ncbi:hypothetical protein [Yoonia sp.]|jgi:hypothetical protein|uniref:hypothetical protein n=1 Tax=Yoonia sp. TaxID=2212373 RepID=UPI0025D85756|nr:hypothetical protein [Yoonia sp.]
MKAPPSRAKLFDLAVPFFLPMWRRVLAVTVPILWSFLEFSTANYFWGLIFMGLGGIAAYKFRIADWEAVAAEAAKAKEDT